MKCKPIFFLFFIMPFIFGFGFEGGADNPYGVLGLASHYVKDLNNKEKLCTLLSKDLRPKFATEEGFSVLLKAISAHDNQEIIVQDLEETLADFKATHPLVEGESAQFLFQVYGFKTSDVDQNGNILKKTPIGRGEVLCVTLENAKQELERDCKISKFELAPENK